MTREDKLKISLNSALISGIFCITVALLMLLNYLQMSRNKPLESKALTALVQQLSQDTNSEALKEEIRNFDLLARKAYFNTQWQVKTGGYLLLFGAIVFATSLRLFYAFNSKITEPSEQEETEIKSRFITQRWVVITGSVLVILGVIASFASVDHLKLYETDKDISHQKAAKDLEQIEVITVGKEPQNNQLASTDSTLLSTTTVGALPDSSGGAEPVIPKFTFPSINEIKANAPAFRGPFGNGVYFHKNTPIEWDAQSGKNVIWKTAVPKQGYNSPVLWDNKLFFSGADKSSHEVFCLDRNSGKELWRQVVDHVQGSPAASPKVTDDTGLAAPSLTTDGNGVYAIFANGDIIGFDMDGNRLWARNLGMPDNHYGHSSSLLILKDKLFIQYDTNKNRKLIALNTSSGETIWETPRKGKISWASPILAQVNGKFQVVLANDPLVAGYDAETGNELWSVDCLMGEVGPSPAYGSGLIIAGNENAKLVAIDPTNKSIVWENDEFMPEVASPVISNGLLFVATSYGVLVCYDATTGEKYWEKEEGSGYYSSPVIVQNKLYTYDTEGKMRVFEVSKEMKILGEGHAAEKVTTTPTFADGRMYLRTPRFIYCIGNK